MLLKRKLNTVICEEEGLDNGLLGMVPDELDFKFYGGGKGGAAEKIYVPQQTTPTYMAPPPAPKKDEAATLELANEEDEEVIQRNAMRQGARSLRIPLGTGL